MNTCLSAIARPLTTSTLLFVFIRGRIVAVQVGCANRKNYLDIPAAQNKRGMGFTFPIPDTNGRLFSTRKARWSVL